MNFRRWWLISLFALLVFAQQGSQYPASLLAGLHWRDVGPMRGGRSFGVAGHADQPDTYYFGSVGGGVWKTENSGHTWLPISDEGIAIGSIGAIAVAPSNANVVYVGTGEPDIRSQHSYGIGMFKSSDAGKTWTHIGLEGTRQIGRVVVDPADANRVYVAALGNVYGPNPDRGLYRSTDGGKTWKKILFKTDDPNNVGAIDVAIDPKNYRVLYASLWATRRPPWSVYAPSNMPGGGLYKSTDGGDTWKPLTTGLPADSFVGKIGIAVSPSNPNRLWAVVDDIGAGVAPARGGGGDRPTPHGGVYTSDDAGASWKLMNSENRLWGRGWYFGGVAVDPTNPDKAYVINTATYMTTDGGKTFVPIKGAPGGDDYHQMWVNPKDGHRMVLSSDQGTVVSVDGGKSWSTWYNQPTAEIYHVAADNRFPYWLYGAQQDSGGVGVSTWSREGVLSFRNWEPTCLAGESNTVLPDPKDGNILYGSGNLRCDQNLNLALPGSGPLPPSDPDDLDRKTWTLPQVFSLADEGLYYANQFVMRSRDRGKTWQKISPDLTRLNPPVPATLDPLTAKDIDQPMTARFGVVYTIGPSPLQATTIWAGTDDGLIHVTRDDGKSWQNVTPPAMTPWSKVSQIEAGHFDAEMLMPAFSQNPERLQPPAHLRARLAILLRQPVPERAIREADFKMRDHLRMREPARFEIPQRLRRLLQRLVIIIDHLAKHVAIRRLHFNRRRQPLHRCARSFAQDLDRVAETEPPRPHHPIDDAPSGVALAQTMPQIFVRTHDEARSLVVMERARPNQIRPMLAQLDPRRGDEAFQRNLPF
jgi:photosystem II stability/assembly factor-like uncharacterized protein